MIYRMTAVLFTAALTACATANQPSRPPMVLPKSLAVDVETQWPENGWWRAFGSPALSSLIEEARIGNADIAVALARVDQARANLRSARAPLLPSLDASGKALQQGTNSSSGASSGRYANAELVATWEADLWGRLRSKAQSARATLTATHHDQQAVLMAVDAQVATTWLTIGELRTRREIAEDNLVIARSLLAVMEAKRRVGVALASDVASQRTLVSQIEASIAELGRMESEAIAALAVLTGKPAQEMAVEVPGIERIVLPPISQPGLTAELLVRRPDVAAAEASLVAAGADVASARSAMLPRITLSAGGGGQVGAGPSEALYQLIAGLTAPLFDNGNLAAQRDLATGIWRERVASYRKAVLGALADTERCLKAIAYIDQEVVARRTATEQAQQSFSEVQTRYVAGKEDRLAVLNAQRVMYDAQDSLAIATAERLRASVALYEALGGGWKLGQPLEARATPLDRGRRPSVRALD